MEHKEMNKLDLLNAVYLGEHEWETESGEYEYSTILETPSHLIAGSSTNTCFLVDISMRKDKYLSIQDNLEVFIDRVEGRA